MDSPICPPTCPKAQKTVAPTLPPVESVLSGELLESLACRTPWSTIVGNDLPPPDPALGLSHSLVVPRHGTPTLQLCLV